jgi:hypothetical protein
MRGSPVSSATNLLIAEHGPAKDECEDDSSESDAANCCCLVGVSRLRTRPLNQSQEFKIRGGTVPDESFRVRRIGPGSLVVPASISRLGLTRDRGH